MMMTALVAMAALLGAGEPDMTPVRQLTFGPQNHDLDNGDNFSPDGRFLVYDVRETIGPGIDNCQGVEKVEIATGATTVLYRPPASVTGSRPAPGIGAASYSPVADLVTFIHGPFVEELDVRGPYGKPNRAGATVPGDGSGKLTWADRRDIATDRDTIPGAHRGGTHRHEYSLDGRRIGFTYDDFLLPAYARTIGYMEPNAAAPEGATHYFALLVRPVSKGTAKPGELEQALGDSWVGPAGSMRAFIGTVRNDDGETYEDSLYVVEIPAGTDITTADAGSATRFPSPPQGLVVRRLTHTWASGIVRGSHDGSRIAYYAKDANGETQVFVIASDGSDRSDDAAKRPVQVTSFEGGAGGALRWHPSGDYLFCSGGNAVVAVCVKPGTAFGKTQALTDGEGAERTRVVVSPDGGLIAFNQAVPTKDAAGTVLKNYAGLDFMQIFVVPFAEF
jgi:hypothetical protein